jgi:hypothetical protein
VHRFPLRGIRFSPALVIAMISLFVALGATAWASNVVPLAKRALTADRAKVADVAKVAKVAKTAKSALTANTANSATTAGDSSTLNGQSAAQIAATPGPASSIAGTTFTVRSKGWSIQNEGNVTTERAMCNTGEKATGGGFDMANGYAYPIADAPLTDLSGWLFRVKALSGNTVPANGSVWVICAKVS